MCYQRSIMLEKYLNSKKVWKALEIPPAVKNFTGGSEAVAAAFGLGYDFDLSMQPQMQYLLANEIDILMYQVSSSRSRNITLPDLNDRRATSTTRATRLATSAGRTTCPGRGRRSSPQGHSSHGSQRQRAARRRRWARSRRSRCPWSRAARKRPSSPLSPSTGAGI